VQPTESVPYRRILVPIDPDIDNKVERELGTRLLHLGTSLAQSEGAELLVGHAWSPFAEAKLKDHLDCCDLPFSAEPYSIRSDLPTSVTPVEEDREWSCQS
jgi:hypothetical protein